MRCPTIWRGSLGNGRAGAGAVQAEHTAEALIKGPRSVVFYLQSASMSVMTPRPLPLPDPDRDSHAESPLIHYVADDGRIPASIRHVSSGVNPSSRAMTRGFEKTHRGLSKYSLTMRVRRGFLWVCRGRIAKIPDLDREPARTRTRLKMSVFLHNLEFTYLVLLCYYMLLFSCQVNQKSSVTERNFVLNPPKP